MTNEKNWYAIYTKPRFEKAVNSRLLENGIETYFPTIKCLREWSDRKKWIELPLFNSYLFVHIHTKQFETVRRTTGVVNFVYHAGKPAVIREKKIQALEEFLGNVEHESIEFVANDQVQISQGILSGKKGKVLLIKKNTATLLIEELGSVIKAELKKSALIKI